MRTVLFLSLTVLLVITVMVLPPLSTANKFSQDKGTESAGMVVGYAKSLLSHNLFVNSQTLESRTSAGFAR